MQETAEGFRLSPQQKHLWLSQAEGPARCCQLGVDIEGGLDCAALRDALRKVVARHEILRTTFHRQPGLRVPFQVVAETSEPAWGELDLGGLPDAQQEARLEEERAAERSRPFDYERGPLLRARVFRLSATRHHLLLSLPSLVADSRSLSNIVLELARLASGEGGDAEADGALQYADFSEWHNELLESEEAAESRAFWQGRRPSADATFPLASPAGAHLSAYAPGLLSTRVETEVTGALRSAAESRGVGVEEFLLACFVGLLSRHSAPSPAPAVAVLSEGRDHAELSEAVGPYARLLPLSVAAAAGASFGELLERTAEGLREARRFKEHFVPELTGGRDGSPVVDVSFAYEQRAPEFTSGGLRWSPRGTEVSVEPVTLALRCTAGDERLELEWHYDASRLSRAGVAAVSEQFMALLRSAAEGSDSALEELDGVGEEQRHRLTREWNATGKGFAGADLCVHDLVARHAGATPEAVAVVCGDGRLTYGELDARANRLARYLRGRGVGAETPVAVMMERSTGLLVAMLGVLKAGGAYVPLDPAYPQDRLGWMVEDTGAPVVLTQASLAGGVPAGGAEMLVLDRDWARVSEESGDAPDWDVSNGQLAYVIYTSGSTGRPKGVMITHRSLTNYTLAAAERLEFTEGFSYASVSTFAADLGHTMVFPALASGSTLHLVTAEVASDAAVLSEYFLRERVDCLKIVPSHLSALLGAGGAAGARVLPRKRLVLGGEASSWELVERVRELCGRDGSEGEAQGCRVYNHYGPTETTVGALAQRVDGRGGEDARRAGVGLGRPMGNMRAYVLDGGMRPAGVGVAGELYLGGAGVARGYLKRPSLTAERFVPDPFSGEAGARLYRTGDLTRWLPDGQVEFIGRVDNQVKFHGFRVELNEIRTALNRHAQIRDSVVRMVNDRNGNAVLVAYYVSRQELEVSQLRETLTGSILEETMPNVFVHLKRLPLTLNGKVDHNALPSLEEVRQRTKRVVVAPRTPAEEQLVSIWSEVLGVAQVGVEDNFFELGGHSLLATRVMTRVREQFKVDVPLRTLFEEPTIAAIALAITQMQAGAQDDEEMALLLREIKGLSGDVAQGVQ